MNALAPPPTSPRIGFNHNVMYRGRVYHVQTEDSGNQKGHIFTHLFFDGIVISSNKVDYGALPSGEFTTEQIVNLMKESHKTMLRRLRDGGLDEQLGRFLDRAGPPREPAPAATESSDHESPLQRLHRLRETIDMGNVNNTLTKLNTEITGALGVALVDHDSGMCLGTAGTGIDLEIAAAGNMEVVRAKRRVMQDLAIDGGIEDILITLQSQYHIIRPVGTSLFLYLAIDRKTGNLALARHKLAAAGAELVV